MRGLLGILIAVALVYILFPGIFIISLFGGILHLVLMFFLAWLIIKILVTVFSILAAVITFPLLILAGLILFPILLPFAIIYLICLLIGVSLRGRKAKVS